MTKTMQAGPAETVPARVQARSNVGRMPMRSQMRRLVFYCAPTIDRSRPTGLAGRLRLAVVGLALLCAAGSFAATPVAPDEPAAATPQAVPHDARPIRGAGPETNSATPADVPAASVMGFESRPLTSITVNIGHQAGAEPADVARGHLSRLRTEGSDAMPARDWPIKCYQWEAPALAYRPLYFEEVNLERYGYAPRGLRVVQPAVSAGQFFTTVLVLPYRMVAEPARRPVYNLGHYRPGSDVPYRVVAPPTSLCGASAQAGVIAGLIFLIP